MTAEAQTTELLAEQVTNSFSREVPGPPLRQQVLILYLANSALDSEVTAWTRYDGTGQSRPTTGDSDEPPYATGLDAMLDGWRLMQLSQLQPHTHGHEYETGYLPYECVFERILPMETSA